MRRVREYVADSPFEYQKNCLLYLPKNLKKCRRGSQEEAEMIAGSYPFTDLFDLRAYAGAVHVLSFDGKRLPDVKG